MCFLPGSRQPFLRFQTENKQTRVLSKCWDLTIRGWWWLWYHWIVFFQDVGILEEKPGTSRRKWGFWQASNGECRYNTLSLWSARASDLQSCATAYSQENLKLPVPCSFEAFPLLCVFSAVCTIAWYILQHNILLSPQLQACSVASPLCGNYTDKSLEPSVSKCKTGLCGSDPLCEGRVLEPAQGKWKERLPFPGLCHLPWCRVTEYSIPDSWAIKEIKVPLWCYNRHNTARMWCLAKMRSANESSSNKPRVKILQPTRERLPCASVSNTPCRLKLPFVCSTKPCLLLAMPPRRLRLQRR